MTRVPIMHARGEGEANRASDLDPTFRITPHDTEGAFSVFEEVIEEGTR